MMIIIKSSEKIMASLKFSLLVNRSSRNFQYYRCKNFHAKLNSNFQRRHESTLSINSENGNSSSDSSERCKSINDNKQSDLFKLIDKFEDSILKDIDCSHTKQMFKNDDDIDKFLAEPTWSTTYEYGQKGKKNPKDKFENPQDILISNEEIQKLLRLSALPSPHDPSQLEDLREDLQSQLNFVRKIQCVNTEGIKPLVCVRDETTEGLQESTITLNDLQVALSNEYRKGKYQRPRKQESHILTEETEWDVFANSQNVVEMNGEKYFIVKQQKSASVSELQDEIYQDGSEEIH
ncbi:putative duf726 domain-containing protein [Erysiphe necator]|uniref:Putative duf726 domain-containing protein n=1 Tax=Uncinula necator TaxID=52586 RepID=A0A0B1P0P2_UNCNE|nr:putative duf726 domain-containing protein [Erysiphe necator]